MLPEDLVLAELRTFAEMTPEEDESWESWYHAAFDMVADRIKQKGREFRNNETEVSPDTGSSIKARLERTMTDHGRMLWQDDVEGHCPSPELCFEHGPSVRCSPCAIKQADAAGIETMDATRVYLPEVCRLNRELAATREHSAELRGLVERAIHALRESGQQQSAALIEAELAAAKSSETQNKSKNQEQTA